ncbi:MAG: c-type cytochrome [Campylobacterales bacterium]
MRKVVFGMLIFAGSLFAADGATIYQKCTVCHGKDAKMVYLNKVPALAGKDKALLIERMQGYKKGEINLYGMGTLMTAQAKLNLKSDADIEAVAEYLTNLK